jgi:tRNA pseudouridine32 synthase/23S rRNA pseudouridine746 synthase
MSAPDLEKRLLYRDGMALIIDKPAGFAVHEGGVGVAHLRPYLAELQFGLPNPPELAHRLDRDTSGCLVLGRHRQALKELGRLFANGRAEKTYWALTVGAPAEESGLIDKPLFKVDPRRGRMIVDQRGQTAQTESIVKGRDGRIAWLELKPLTGRTHQLRVHLASIGCPILGDRLYGAGTADLLSDTLCLLSRRIVLPLYHKKPPIEAVAPPPEHMLAGLAGCGYVTAT